MHYHYVKYVYFLFSVIIKAVLSVITSSGACWAPRCPPSAWSRPPRAPAASAWTCPGCGPPAAPPPPPGVCTISVEYRDTTSVLTLTCNSLRFPPVSPPSYWAEQFVSRPPPWHSPVQLFPCDNIRSGGRGITNMKFIITFLSFGTDPHSSFSLSVHPGVFFLTYPILPLAPFHSFYKDIM